MTPARLAIVLVYPDGRLANAWFRAYKRIKRAVRTKGLNAWVELRPTTDLPSRVGVLVLPPGLDAAGLPATSDRTIATTAEAAQSDVDALLAELLADGRLVYAPAPSRRVAVHRGFLPVDARAWSTDE